LFTSNKDYFEGLYIRAKENEPPVPVAPLLLYEEVNLAFLFFSSFSKSISRYVNFDHGQIPELDIDDLVMTSQIEDIFKI
jgi:hypothetical protein